VNMATIRLDSSSLLRPMYKPLIHQAMFFALALSDVRKAVLFYHPSRRDIVDARFGEDFRNCRIFKSHVEHQSNRRGCNSISLECGRHTISEHDSPIYRRTPKTR